MFFLLLLAFPISSVGSFSLPYAHTTSTRESSIVLSIKVDDENDIETCRGDFLFNTSKLLFLTTTSAASVVEPAHARGRSTLDSSYDRYVPRILAGGEFYSKDLRNIIGKSDWVGLRDATAEPPKKSKKDRVKADGGVAERASKAGGFSDSRVLVACDLFAAAFSDNSISAKTKAMKSKVEVLREVVNGMNSCAKQALGEENAGGGLFGIGAKKPSQAELAKTVRELYVKGGNAYNEFIYAANDELPIQYNKLPYL